MSKRINISEEKKKRYALVISFLVLIVCIVGSTYAYFAITASNNSITGKVGGSSLDLTVTKVLPVDNDDEMIPQLEDALGDAISEEYSCVDGNGKVVCQVYSATVTNLGSEAVTLNGNISFTGIEDMPNLKWKLLTDSRTIDSTKTANSASTDEVTFVEDLNLTTEEATKSSTYYFVFWIEETNELQTDNGEFRAIINFDSPNAESGVTSTITPEENLSILITGSEFKETIPDAARSIVFTDEVAPSDVTVTDVSQAKDSSVVSWLDGTTYKVSSQQSGVKVISNSDSSHMFEDFNGEYDENISIDVSMLDTSSVTDMSYMFNSVASNYCILTLTGLNSFDVSNVTDMSYMFYLVSRGYSFEITDFSGWDVSNVTDMSYMFYGTAYYGDFNIGDIGNWDVSNVIDMSTMFCDAGHDYTFYIGDISKWNVSNVTNMSSMFSGAGGAGSFIDGIDYSFNIGNIGKWDVSNVTDMSYMFFEAGGYVSTFYIGDLSNWNVSNVTNMSNMFNGAGYSATTFSIGDLSEKTITLDDGTSYTAWDVSNVTNMLFMFSSAGYSATTFSIGNLSNWDTSEVTNMERMFRSTGKNATWSLDCSSWNVDKVTTYTDFNINVTDKVTAPTWKN